MTNNFVNLFNNLTALVASTRTTNMQNARQGMTNQLSVFMANIQGGGNIQNASPLPQVNLQNAQQIQQNEAINQQLQESILQTQEALKEFTQADKSALVKGMLNMPEDLSELLKLMSNKNENLTNAEFMKMLSMINVNGKEAAAKLSKLLVILGANNIKGAEKLQEVYSIINAFSAGSAQNASQLMKNIILLYLPWLPIGENNNFEIGFKENVKEKNGADGKSGDEEDSDSDSLSIFIQTVNFGNVKVTLYMGAGNTVNMFVDCVENFPKEQLQEMVKGDSANLNLQTDISFAHTNVKNVEKNEEADFSVNVSKFINPFLMLMAHAIIKAVIDIDKHTSLIEKRRAG